MDLVERLEAAARKTGAALLRRICAAVLMAILDLTGAGFALAAGWSTLAQEFGSITASAGVAAGFFGAAAILFVTQWALRRRALMRTRKPPQTPSQPPLAPMLIQTFVASLHAGRRFGAKGRRV